MKSNDQLTIIFPVYNEKDSIEHVLKEWITELHKLHITYNIIICEDGSTDGTTTLLRKIQPLYKFEYNHKNTRRGYGGAVLDGIRAAKTPYILCVDSDGQCDPRDVKQFLSHKTDSDILIGWRTRRADASQRLIFSKLFHIFFQILFPTSIHDPSAPYVLFKKETVLPILHYLNYLQEGFWWGFIGACNKKHLKVQELPIHHRSRFLGDTQVYHLKKIPSIAIRNAIGLIRLKMSL